MGVKYTNIHKIPLPLAVMLAHDEYEHREEQFTISVTGLLKSVRQIVLGSRDTSGDSVVDISSLLASTRGTALHDALERAWLSDRLPQTLAELGLPKKVIEQIRVNPTDGEHRPLDVFLEVRNEKKVGRWTITGKFDMSIEYTATDLKNTSVFKWSSDPEMYVKQLSIYKWLNPDLMKKPHGNILFWFNDFSVYSNNKPDYPPFSLAQKSYPLHTPSQTEAWIKTKLGQVDANWETPEAKLPFCTASELWQGKSEYKYFTKAGAKRATKVFASRAEAHTYMMAKGSGGEVREFKGKAKACTYCDVRLRCSQYKLLVSEGLAD